MIAIEHDITPDRVVLRGTAPKTKLRGRFPRHPTLDDEVTVDDWVGDDVARCAAIGALRRFGEENPGTVKIEKDEIVASHGALASLGAAQAGALGLPAPPPFSLKVGVRGVIGSPSFRLRTEWRHRGLPVVAKRLGAFLWSEAGEFLIPEPLLSAVEQADRFDGAATDLPGHWDALARFRRLFEGLALGATVEMVPFLSGIRIFTGAALSLQLRKKADGIRFDPVLFSARPGNEASEDGRPVSEEDGVLPADLLRSFQRDGRTGFSAFPTAKGTYLLGPNSYLVVDDALKTALEVVREKQQAPPEERRGFAANPRAAISERLTQELGRADSAADPTEIAETVGELTSRLFVETPEYALRAVEVQAWEPPAFDFLPRLPRARWPERFTIEIGGRQVELTPAAATDLETHLRSAGLNGKPFVAFRGSHFPATAQVREELAIQLASLGREDQESPTRHARAEDEPGRVEAPDLVGGFDDDERCTEIEPRGDFGKDVEWPARLTSQPFPHQFTCFRWLVESWAAGQPGVLNADDQGLGKTVETLAFLAWLQDVPESAEEDTAARRRDPILVVAPTGLLRTWETEVTKHLDERGLYAAHRVYGNSLKAHRVRGLPGVDTDDGRCRLHFEQVRAAGDRNLGHRQWLLTTYQTLTNYQHSFRRLRFSAVVFDEIQMLKNPATLRALAAKRVRADFRVGLTGTPIENRTADHWAVMDALAPGRLGSLQDYVARYGEAAEESMRELHDRLFEPRRTCRGNEMPPLVMRRLKQDTLGGLPAKTYRRYRETMPAGQTKAYDEALELVRSGEQGSALRMLQRLRAVSLHPSLGGSVTGTTDACIEHSARLARVREVLDKLNERGERALLFIENLDIQAFLAQWLRSRYGLRDVPVINGSTPVSKRHEQVRRFQERDSGRGEFGVFVLSPRAAGFGLTLTAATHVIHISRWWNPAVEEQCNDRIYRIGQSRDVTVHLPMAIHPTERERSFDHVLDALLQRKRELARSALWPPVTAKSDVSQMMKAILGPGQPTLALDPPPRPPELLCRRTLDGWSWTLALETPAELGIDEVLFDGEPLERSDEEWEISSCVGELHAKTANSRVHPIELFAGRPLIFKTAPDWDGPGRRCRGVSRSGRCRASSCPATTSEGEQGPRRHWSSPHPQVHWEA